MPDSTRFVGLDVHRDSVAIAVAPLVGPIEDSTELPHQLPRLRRYFERLLKAGPVRACYEAGGCGYGLQRAMTSWGVVCEVIAPSLIPRRPGDRVKTDRRDAIMLATAYRRGDLAPVRVPSPEEERVRGLTRAREAFKNDVHESKQHVLKFLQLRGIVYREGKKAWTKRFRAWLEQVRPTLDPLDARVLAAYLSSLSHKETLRAALDAEVERVAQTRPYAEQVSRLRCLRGVDTLSALSLAVEIGDASRFDTPRRLMGYLGLNVSEHSSGGSTRRGAITKAGNTRCRRLLVEAAWHYRHRPAPSAAILARREGQSPEVLGSAARADDRLHRRFAALLERMPAQKAVVAVARELVGFVWAHMVGTPHALAARMR